MKRFVIFVIVVSFATITMPAFAGSGCGYKASGEEKTIFQTVYDTMSVKCEKAKYAPSAGSEPSIFQKMCDGIKEGSAKAKNQSLRGQK